MRGIFGKESQSGEALPGRDVFPSRLFSLFMGLSEEAVTEDGISVKESLPISLLFWKLH